MAYIAPTDSSVVESGSPVHANGVVIPVVQVEQYSAIVVEVTHNVT